MGHMDTDIDMGRAGQGMAIGVAWHGVAWDVVAQYGAARDGMGPSGMA